MKTARLFMASLLYRLQHSDNAGLLLIAVIVGMATGVGVFIFRRGIEFFHILFQEVITDILLHPVVGGIAVILSLTLAGACVGFIMDKFIGHEKYHGVAGIMESVAYAGGRLRYRRIPFKAFASALSIGGGASVGPEDPSVQIGANIGSLVGQILRLSEERVVLLVAAGASSAIAAAFKAPIAGVFFALEVIFNGTYTSASVGVIVLAAVISSAFTQAVEPHPEMGPFSFNPGSPLEIAFYIPLGLFLALFAVSFIRIVYWQHDLWQRFTLPRPAKTAAAGAIVGCVAVFLPEIMGTGRDTMNAVLAGEAGLSLIALLVLGLVKMATTATSLAGGFVGGIFAPTLFVGTMLGAAYGQIVTSLAGLRIGSDPQVYAIAGMAGMMAGVVRSPITAIMMVFELTNDYRLILPIMLTTVVCMYFAQRFEPSGMYILALKRQGVRLPEGHAIDVMQTVTVGEAMVTPAPVISENAPLIALRDKLREYHTMSLCVVDESGTLVGIVTLSDLQRAYESVEADRLCVGDICTRDVITTTPNEAVWKAIRTMSLHDVGRLPVVKPHTREVIGLIGRHGVVRAYNIALTRKLQEQHTVERIRLNTLTGAHVFEVYIGENAPVAGKHINEIHWPAESVVASIQRKGKLVIPHGSTELKAGDLLMIVGDPRIIPEIQGLAGL
jgi:chloride channel protein, CIC family